MHKHHQTTAKTLNISEKQVSATAALLAEGGTVPFVARYRKEATGSLDETQISAIRDQLAQLGERDKRLQAVIESLVERDLLTDSLQRSLEAAPDLATLEDIYLPFRPKRRTRSMIAREKGLEPLASAIFRQNGQPVSPEKYIDPAKEVLTAEDALDGARDIVAEWASEDSWVRAKLRQLFSQRAMIQSKVIKKNKEKGAKFRDYFDWQEPVLKVPGHRLLAMFRGENEKVLSLTVRPDVDDALNFLKRRFLKREDFSGQQMRLALADSYKRLLTPSLENELRNSLKERADQEAIRVFADNLRELLLAPPLGQKRVMALDPGFRTGAKLACLDGQGQLLHFATIYPTLSERQSQEAGKVVKDLCRQYRIEAIAIGNGTAGRETETFARALGLDPVVITMVDESGASVYSASETARKEFPNHDLTVRGAVSIGRRLQDPLAELVKIDPKAIGVGQYQHDVNQTDLKKRLAEVVESCVNNIGVEVNTASVELLTHVSGLGPILAENIIAYRQANGPFATRKQLLKVPRLGAKAFEQGAGFLRVHGAKNPLDDSAVHPERYALVEQMAKDAGCTVTDLIKDESKRAGIDISQYVSDTVGLPTLKDILTELAKPGRDPRADFEVFAFADGVNTIDDIWPGMKIPGIVTNVTKFGAFVDIGVHNDGLIHISQLADRFVKDPAEIVKVRQQLTVRVLEVDQERKRIALSLKSE